jgi:hypothetical protein
LYLGVDDGKPCNWSGSEWLTILVGNCTTKLDPKRGLSKLPIQGIMLYCCPY